MKKSLINFLIKPMAAALLSLLLFSSCIAPHHGHGRPPAPLGLKH